MVANCTSASTCLRGIALSLAGPDWQKAWVSGCPEPVSSKSKAIVRASVVDHLRAHAPDLLFHQQDAGSSYGTLAIARFADQRGRIKVVRVEWHSLMPKPLI